MPNIAPWYGQKKMKKHGRVDMQPLSGFDLFFSYFLLTKGTTNKRPVEAMISGTEKEWKETKKQQ